ncbi:hypothetical protein FisN_26Hu175 [Fistulifera solaris]|uniref:Uncharacterized protein n=1 Tax=Fistulifera solaris TaxID=1519565 RepID=A0A1Z5JXW1_FISSO|nr:hypothetical protein FisN_26Hu175 [Fistulifera solaris]|eukprot:GAX18873.1 hypothetical protein FisN_26Hu175 [Fistulifera solaris]
MVHVEIDLDNLLSHCDCDFAKILNPEEIACLMDATPGRQYAFTAGEWSAEQSIVLATRPYSVDLTLGQSSNGYACFEFQDGGTAFVKALETREKIFGSLCLDVDYSDEDWTPLSNKNLKRLFQIETWFEKLTLPMLDPSVALLAFSAKTKALVYELDPGYFEESDFQDLQVVSKILDIKINFDSSDDDGYNNNWDKLLLAFLQRLAALGHFERLKISLYCDEKVVEEKAAAITNALMAVIQGNSNLMFLKLSEFELCCFDWSPQSHILFKAMEEHQGLETFVVKDYPITDPDYLWLKGLLLRNHNIMVLNSLGKRCSDGSVINNLYSLNRLYNGSARLLKESVLVRQQLVATILFENASKDYQRTALVLSQHTDLLCDLIESFSLDEGVAPLRLSEESESSRASLRRNPMTKASKKSRLA